MTTNFTTANIWQDFKNSSQTEQGTLDDNSNEVLLGPRLNEAVRHFANGYLEKLELGPAHKATDERAKLLDLQWGRIEHDGAMLRGLGVALSNFATVFGTNVSELGKRWQGESYDAFKAAMDKVQRTMAAYGEYAKVSGEGLINSMSQLRVLFDQFAQDSVNSHLNFSDVSAPERWHRAGKEPYGPIQLLKTCPCHEMTCPKWGGEQTGVYNGRFVTERRWKIAEADPCGDNAERALIMLRNMVDECDRAREGIRGKLGTFFEAVGATVDGVSTLYEAALGNVYELANKEVFSGLRVIGGGGGGAPVSGGDTSAAAGPPPGGGGGDYSGGGGNGAGPGGVAEPLMPEPAIPEPAVPAEEAAPAEAVAQEPPVEPAADQQATVEIKDGDRTIGVTSPDGEGRVRVTVEDGAGNTKTYELDFDAASGLAPQQPGEQAGPQGSAPDSEAPEQVPARTDGKCVIQDGQLTITAERPLFSPDSIQLTVDDGTGNPTNYTFDFDEQQTADGAADPAAAGPQGTASRPEADQVAGADQVAAPPEAAPEEEAAPAAAAKSTEQQATPGPAAPTSTANGDGTPAPAATTGEPTATEAGAGQTRPAASQPGWIPDREPSGSVSGVLVPDQPDGEAGLSKASDDARPDTSGTSGMAGAGLPMGGGGAPPGAGGGAEAGRAGSGWSVHGDLFDSGEPVYSMHGVLGDDERATE
ncbi:MAG: hypothetical protein WBA97_15555 [Actinophytocola sp.]|uniref:hypothetical protein n=1 Tax=Actinophytocola sp. TaxID=1872138 RepID=UPI003C760030